MKQHFRGYYKPTQEEFDLLWRDATFSFDANFLLNVYRYTPPTQQKMLAILERLDDRVWIPHQAVLEFHRNRPRVIATQASAYEHAKKAINDAFAKLEGQLSGFARHPFIDCKKICEALHGTRDRLIESLDRDRERHPDLDENDELRERLATVLSDAKVGSPFMNDPQKHRADAEKRYKQKVPPGFRDDDEDKEHPYGDYYIWRQLMDRAKEKACPIIFTTDDRKDDWWWRLNGKTIGPRPELVQEMITESGGQMFYMYTSDSFLKFAGKRLGVEVSEDAVKEVRTVREQDELLSESPTVRTATGVDPSLVLGVPGRAVDSMASSSHDVDRGIVRAIGRSRSHGSDSKTRSATLPEQDYNPLSPTKNEVEDDEE